MNEIQDELQQAIEGNQEALQALLLNHYDELERHIAPQVPKNLQGIIQVDDVLQETFLCAFRDIQKHRPNDEDHLIAWLKQIATHRLRDLIRVQSRKKRGGDLKRADSPQESGIQDLVTLLSGGGHTPSKYVSLEEAKRAIIVGLQSLSADHREALTLRYFEGLPIDSIARQMGKSEGSIRGLLDRGRKALEDMMGTESKYLS